MNRPRCPHGAMALSIAQRRRSTSFLIANICSHATTSSSRAASRNSGIRRPDSSTGRLRATKRPVASLFSLKNCSTTCR